jgi:uncharacterized protein (TIGR00725 family)
MGSSLQETSNDEISRLAELAGRLGRMIAKQGCIVITGATTGLPDAVSRAARALGGLCIGISPAASREEHLGGYGLPDDAVDVLVCTGFGLKGRNVINVRASDIVIIIGGGIGTLNEFTIAFDEDKIIGVLEGTGGAADNVREIASLSRKRRSTPVLYDDSPERLVESCLALLGDQSLRR